MRCSAGLPAASLARAAGAARRRPAGSETVSVSGGGRAFPFGPASPKVKESGWFSDS